MFEGKKLSIAAFLAMELMTPGIRCVIIYVKVMMETCASAQKLAERAAYDLKAGHHDDGPDTFSLKDDVFW